MPFCVVCTSRHYIDLGGMPEPMLADLAAEFQIKPEQVIVALHEILIGSTYAEIDTLFERLTASATRHGYSGIRAIHSS